MALLTYQWKGAVQPAEAGVTSVLVDKSWKGAIEPAGVVAAASSGGRSGPGLSFGSMGKMGA